MQKKIALTSICFCFLFLFGGCYASDFFNPPNPEEDYFYEVSWYFQEDGANAGESVPEDYYFCNYNTIYKYTVTSQELTSLYRFEAEDDNIDDYAIDDDYIFFVTGADGGPGVSVKLWKYDRAAGTCELFTELSEFYYDLELYGGYVFYGGYTDVDVCPIEGNPKEDSVSLLAQFPENVSVQKMRDIVYQGWNIRRESDGANGEILFIKDQENDQVILDREDVWLDVNGELIHFTGGSLREYEYQRENEQEKRSFDCLKVYGDFFSADTKIRRERLGVEDGKIMCLLTERYNTPCPYEVPQNRVKKDVLFEIDLEANSSKVIYATEGSKIRIIGYRGGTLYLLEDDIIYRENPEGGDREKVFDLRDGSVDLYRSDGRHTDIQFIMWGDNLIVRPPYGTNGMFTIPLFDQTEDSQEKRN